MPGSMKKKQFCRVLPLWLALFLSHFSLTAQTPLACNALVIYSLDNNCTGAIEINQALVDPNLPGSFRLEVNRVGPFWSSPFFDRNDVGKTYQYRVTEPSSGNRCWGSVKIEDKLPPTLTCPPLYRIYLNASGAAQVRPTDIGVTAADGCTLQPDVKFLGNIPEKNYACTDIGVNQETITASDSAGNKATCYVTLVVQDSFNTCDNCISQCPPAQVVSYETGMYQLLPALQSSNFAPFAAFGMPVVSPGCFDPMQVIITETSYHASALGYNWFERYFYPANSGSSTCVQSILFPNDRTLIVKGRVFLDSIQNCLSDASEIGISIYPVVATKLPGNEKVQVFPDQQGNYTLTISMNGLDSAVVIQPDLPAGFVPTCPNIAIIPANTPQLLDTLDFGIFTSVNCSLLEVSLGVNRLRRCTTSTYQVQYINRGLSAVPDAYVTLELDSLATISDAGLPFTQSGHLYTFQLGTLQRFASGNFWVKINVSCNAMEGQTVCTEAVIYPNDPCPAVQWSGPIIETRAFCEGDSVRLQIINTGQGNMTEMKKFIVVEDILLREHNFFQLNAGARRDIVIAANGATWRIAAEQATGYPYTVQATDFVEGCGGLNTPGAVTAFGNNEIQRFRDLECVEITGAFDPNDKTATPTGYGADNTVWANVPLEYKIRFQNTGNDTAFLVVIADTLSAFLDPATIEAGASSHRYKLNIQEGGILQFRFENIALPDSNTNLEGSQGFVIFRVAQKKDLRVGTVINGQAAIYFDFNPPIFTNIVRHTIGEPTVTVSSVKSFLPDMRVEAFPNPFAQETTLKLSGYSAQNGTVLIYDVLGRMVQQLAFQGDQCRIERQGMSAGIYYFNVLDKSMVICSGKLSIE
jgi:hypothetical protein